MAKPVADSREDYRYFYPIRWMDNDIYAHVNNAIDYSWFDTPVNGYLLEQQVLDFEGSAQVGPVVESGCQYFAPLAFPDQMTVGLRIVRLDSSSVRYEIGIFRNDDVSSRPLCSYLCG